MASYLPEAGNIQGNFNRVVVGYISALHNFLQEELDRVAPGATPVRRRKNQSQLTPSRGSQGTVGGEPQTVDAFCSELVEGELSQRLFGVIEKINKKFPQIKGREEEEDSIFPTLPGSHLKLTFPALEFVKAVCKVLGLDTTIEPQVRKMRRNLLKLINVGEFDKCADWRDPCISFSLSEVICRTCNHCRDIDLCRDEHKGETVEGKPVWLCASPQCKAVYDILDIERMLIDSLQRKMMGFCLQDLACSKCRQVTQYNMGKRCKCSGDWATTINTKNLAQLLKTFHGLSEHYEMPLLLEQVQWCFKMNPKIAAEMDVNIAQ